MRNLFICSLAVTAAACHPDRPNDQDTADTGPQVVVVTNNSGGDGDSNNDGVQDNLQSVGTGHDSSGEPYVVFFNNPYMPPFQSDLEWIGFGCSMYDGDASDDWLSPCVPLAPYMVDGVQMGVAFVGIREGIHEGDVVDATSFTPDGGGWADPGKSQTEWDDSSFFVSHVNGPNCPIDGQETTTLYGFKRVGNDIIGLGDSVAPPDPACN